MCALVTGVQTCALPIWLHHHHLARDEGAAFVVVASLTTQPKVGHPPVVREASLIAQELSSWLSFLQSIRSASQAKKPKKVSVVLTHLVRSEERRVGKDGIRPCRVRWEYIH